MEHTINTIERIHITKEQFDQIETDIRFNEHIKRYASIRRFCYGDVLDFASGCGYGSYIIAKNPDVKSITGVDIDVNATEWSKTHFLDKKINFINGSGSMINAHYDTLVCLETIEHLPEAQTVCDLVKRCSIDNLIISFPDKKSTHFNKFHYHDFVLQDICNMFDNHVMYKEFRTVDVQFVMLIRLPENAPSHIFKNIKDI